MRHLVGPAGVPGSLIVLASVLLAPHLLYGASAVVFGNSTTCEGIGGGVVYVTLTGTPPFTLQWDDGELESDVEGTPHLRVVHPGSSRAYTLLSMSDANGPGVTSGSAFVTVLPAPPMPQISADGPTTFCEGYSVVLHANVFYDGYQWFRDGIASPPTTDESIEVTVTGNYSVRALTADGCAGPESAPAAVTVISRPSTPVVTAGGPLTFCEGGSVTLTSSSTSDHQWYRDFSTPIEGATGRTYTVTASGIYTVAVIGQDTGCLSQISEPVVVTVNPIPSQPTVTANGPTTFCQGSSVTLTSSSATGNQWYSSGSPIAGATGQTYNATVTGSYTVVVTLLGCTGPSSSATSVTVNPVPNTPTISAGGATTFCEGGAVTLTSSSSIGNQWYRDNALISSATGKTFSATQSGAYTVIVTLNNCSSGPSAAANVTVNPIPATPAIAATQSVASGATGITSSVANHAGSSYRWTITGGGTITGGQGTSTIAYDAALPGTIMTLSVVETRFGCASPVASWRQLVDFNDVPPSNPFHNFVVKIARAGITGGCGGGNFCPASSVTRAQMAVFLLIGEHGSGYVPPVATGVFQDVPIGSFADKFVEQLYREGITSGCSASPLKFCPNDAVTRAQMAVFLLIAEHQPGYLPPPAIGVFNDVPVGSFAASFIEQLFHEGVTGGCSTNPPLYCPGTSTTRDQMAVFLSLTFGLP